MPQLGSTSDDHGLSPVLLDELTGAFALLTRLPVGWLNAKDASDTFAASVWAYPVVGAVVGGIGGAAYGGCAWLAMPPAVCAVWALVVMVLVTGALHEDGLADTADGLGGGRTRAQKLAIMRDSRIGTFGTIALVLSLAVRGTTLTALAQPGRVVPALIVASALGRGAILVLLLALAPARPDGLAFGLRDRRPGRSAAGLGLASAVSFALLPPVLAACAIAATLVSAWIIGWIARRQLDGHTGDVLGTASVCAECVVLTLLITKMGH
jgi:adenosylcobinamide-GDP ribazoletransferase